MALYDAENKTIRTYYEQVDYLTKGLDRANDDVQSINDTVTAIDTELAALSGIISESFNITRWSESTNGNNEYMKFEASSQFSYAPASYTPQVGDCVRVVVNEMNISDIPYIGVVSVVSPANTSFSLYPTQGRVYGDFNKVDNPTYKYEVYRNNTRIHRSSSFPWDNPTYFNGSVPSPDALSYQYNLAINGKDDPFIISKSVNNANKYGEGCWAPFMVIDKYNPDNLPTPPPDFTDEINEHAGKISTLEQLVNELHPTGTPLPDFTNQISEITSRLQVIDTTLEEHADLIGAMEVEQSTLNDRIGDNSARCGVIENNVSALNTRVIAIENINILDNLNNVSEKIIELREDDIILGNTIDNVSARVLSLEENSETALAERLTALEAKFDRHILSKKHRVMDLPDEIPLRLLDLFETTEEICVIDIFSNFTYLSPAQVFFTVEAVSVDSVALDFAAERLTAYPTENPDEVFVICQPLYDGDPMKPRGARCRRDAVKLVKTVECSISVLVY